MRWQYRISFAESNTGICTSEARVLDCLYAFRTKFGTDRVLKVEERFGDGEWTPSELLPTSQDEANSIAGPDEWWLDGAA